MNTVMVTSIEPFDSRRQRVIFDNGDSFVLYKGEVGRFHLTEGIHIDIQILEDIRVNIIKKRARARCLHLLEKKRYSEKKLTEKLLSGGYDAETAREAVEYAKSFHYVDDEALAYDNIEVRWGSISAGAIRTKLIQKGISPDTIDRAFESYLEDNQPPDESELIRQLLSKKGYSHSDADIKERKRIYAFLMRRGFSSDAILREMDLPES